VIRDVTNLGQAQTSHVAPTSTKGPPIKDNRFTWS
jgi:hypothetical protein